MRAAAAVSEPFRGFYYTAAQPSDRCMLVLLGDEGDDFMSRACAKWLTRTQRCNALCIAVRQHREDDTGVHSWPLERIASAVRWVQEEQNISKIGVMGMSMQAAMALSAAARIPDLTLTLALTPCDFVPWGFIHGKKGEEYPSGGSAFSWEGVDLPFQPAMLDRDDYWALFQRATKEHHEMHSRAVFDYSEDHHPLSTETLIPVENIRGSLVLVGAEDDSMWNAAKYIRRMAARVQGPAPALETCLYPFGTHLLVPQRMLDPSLSLAGGLVSRMFVSGRKHPKECKAARLDLDRRLTAVFEHL